MRRDGNREEERPLPEAIFLRPRLCFHLPGALEIKTDGRDSGRANGLQSASFKKVNCCTL